MKYPLSLNFITMLITMALVMLMVAIAPVAMAQVPTTIPTDVQTNLDNASTLALNIGTAMLVLLGAIVAIKWARGALS